VSDLVKSVLKWLGGGTGVAVGLAAISAVQNRPEFLPQLVGAPVLLFSFGVLFVVMNERGRRESSSLHLRTVVAQEQLAAGVHQLVTKNDSRERETQLVLDELAENSKVTREGLRRLIGKLYPGDDFDV